MWIALRDFLGVVAGAERPFAAGEKITDAEAEEMGLSGKPDLAMEAPRAEPEEA